MFKLLYEILISLLGLPIDPAWEYLILFVMGEVSHEIAWWISPGGTFGSVVYWFSKILTFIGIWFFLYAFIALIKLILDYWVWIILVFGIVLLIISMIWICVYKNKNKKKFKQIDIKEKNY